MLVSIRSGSGSSPGNMRAREPEATMTFFVSTVCFLPPFSTSILPPPSSLPYPLMTSILFFFMRNSTPLACLSTIFCLRLRTSRQVELRILAVDPLILGVLEVAPNLGGVQQRLGRNATDVKAGAAQLRIFFDKCGLQSVLPRPDRGGVPPRTATKNHQIVGHLPPF